MDVKELFRSYLVLKIDGRVWAWGNNDYNQCDIPAGLKNVVAIAANGAGNLALKSDGTVVAWGRDYYHGTPLFYVPDGLSGVVDISTGESHSLALKADGTVVAWGNNDHGECNVPAGLSDVIAISANGSNSMALKRDGMMVVWGDNSWGQCNVPVGLKASLMGMTRCIFNLNPQALGLVTIQVPAGVLTALPGGAINGASNVLQRTFQRQNAVLSWNHYMAE